MGCSKTERNNPRPLQREGNVGRGFREGARGVIANPRSQRQYLTVRCTLQLQLHRRELRIRIRRGVVQRDGQRRGRDVSLFKLDTWPRLRDHRVRNRSVYVCVFLWKPKSNTLSRI